MGVGTLDKGSMIWDIRFMQADLRFMNELFRIISGALRLDLDKVRNYTSFLADNMEKAGETGAAARLRKLLAESDHQLRPAGVSMNNSIPVDSETRFPLLEYFDIQHFSEPPLLVSDAQNDTLHEFVSVVKSHSQLEALGVTVSAALLIYGPPGCGKSRMARHLSKELGLPLYIARLDGLISSFLGSTAKNIRAIFEFAAKKPCVLFLDEFDAIAKLRNDNQELGEIKRVVNSFLQNLDSLGSQSTVIAATNHSQLLDPAVWRRFNYRIELPYPDSAIRKEMWRNFLLPTVWGEKEINLLTNLSDGFSGSDIHEVCTRLKRRKIASASEPCLKDAFTALLQLSSGEGEGARFISKMRGLESLKIAQRLRKRDPKLFSHAHLADLFGVSKATAYRWVVRGGN